MITTLGKIFCLLVALFAFSIVTAQDLANNLSVFGPKNFKIKWWRIHFSHNRFKVERPGKGVITITKNTPQKKIWAGFVRLNRKTISLRRFLTSDDLVLEKEVKLRSNNLLLVCLVGTRAASIQIKVKKKETVLLPKVSISASPTPIEAGKSSTLSWNSTNANACMIEPGIGSINVNGSMTVSPIETTTFTITVEGPGGSTSNSVTVVVLTPPEDVDYGIPEDDQQGGAGIVGGTICILNGSNVEYRSDLTFPSPNSLGFSFQAFYNSRSHTLGALGYGWTHTYDASLDSAFQIKGKEFVKIIDQSGRAHYFAEESPGSYKGVFKECTHVKIEEGKFVWYRLDGTVYGFSTLGQLIWIEDKKGNRLELDYDSLGLLSTVKDTASRRALSFYYYGDGLLQRIEGAITAAVLDGVWVTYTYDDYQNLASVTYADGSGFSYLYNDPNDTHNMTEKRNKLNHLLNTWSYDADDRATSKFSLDDKGANNINYFGKNQVEVTDAYGTARTYNLEKIDGVKRVKALLGSASAPYNISNVIRWLYDKNKQVIETESARGTINQYEDYDERGNPRTVKLAVGTPEQMLIRYTYHPTMNVPLSRSEASVLDTEANASKITLWDYDDDLNDIPNEKPTRFLHRIVEQGFTKDRTRTDIPYEYVTTLTYNFRGQLLSIDGPLSGTDDTTTFDYDLTTGDLLSITQPLIGSTIFSEYSAVGRVGKITDVNGLSKRFAYDARGRVIVVTNDADGSSIKFTYNKAGVPNSVTDEDGVKQSFDYDANYGRLIRITDMGKNYIAYAYDAQGNQIEMSKHDPLGTRISRKRWSYQHPTAPGKLWKEINADDGDTVYDYDSEGNIASVKDPNENTTYYAYDPFSRLKTMTQPDNVVTNYGYDIHGNLVSVTDAEGHLTTYEYDDMGRVITSRSPDAGTVTYVYDSAGNPVMRTDAEGITLQYDYDTLNRLTGLRFTDPTNDIIYTYDTGTNGLGRLTGMTDPSGSLSFTYDARGRLAKKTSTIFGHSYTIGRIHSPGNRALSVSYPTGRTLDYARDGLGRMQGLSTTYNGNSVSLVSNIAYNPFGGPRSLRTGAGGEVNNQSGECDCIEIANSGAQMERIYAYDNNRNLTSITATNTPWYNQTFAYDALDRLIEASGRFGAISYSYDNVGNRISRTVNGKMENYYYMPGTNRIQEISNVSPLQFTYDANGNTTGIGNKVLIYNLNNRLIRVEQNGSILGEYTYNGLGQRVTKKVSGVTTVFHYDLDGKVIAESMPDGTITAEYLYMGKIRIAKFEVDRDKMYYYLNDRLGTPQIMTDDNGNVVWEASYQPFGQARVNPKSTVKNNFRFPGQYYDEETGLHYNYHRYYDPGTGRYLTPDPIGLLGGMNLFVYAANNPINIIDPLGLIRWSSVGKGAVSVFIGGVGILGGAAMAGTPTGAGQLLGATIALAGSSAFSYGVGQMIAGFMDKEMPFMGTKEAVIKGTIKPGMTQDKILALNQIIDMLPDVASGRISIPPTKIVEIATYIDYLLSIGYSTKDVGRELERLGYIKNYNTEPCEEE